MRLKLWAFEEWLDVVTHKEMIAMDTAHRIDVRRKAVRNCLAALLAIASVSLIAASDLPPQTTIVSANGIFTNDFDCSFPLQEQVKGTYRDTLYFDRNGTLTREFISPQFQGSLTVTWTNLETGTSLTSHEASTLIIYYNPDGSFQKLANQGLTFHVSVPGQGLLLADVGRIVIERGQGVTFEVGPHQEFNGDTAAFCADLAH